MKIVLVLFILTIQSSYSGNTEVPATAAAYDTLQFVETPTQQWRIKTFAQDQDVHIWSLGQGRDIVELAKANATKHYGDLIKETHVITSDDGIDGLRRALRERGLDANLEMPPSGAVFWAPDGSRYRSKSTPP